ncbi:energy transducer TonB [bacterium]|nr:energy transducer TonB [bacterium]
MNKVRVISAVLTVLTLLSILFASSLFKGKIIYLDPPLVNTETGTIINIQTDIKIIPPRPDETTTTEITIDRRGHNPVPVETLLPPEQIEGGSNHPELPTDITSNSGDTTEGIFVDMSNPYLVKKIIPDYPNIATVMGQEGSVEIVCTVEKDGNVSHVRISKSSGYDSLDAAARNAARVSKFIPAMQSGNPTVVEVILTFKFELSGNIQVTDE